jgi:hypothetical protein
MPNVATGIRASGGKAVRAWLDRLNLQVRFRASGHKSSEGDGRTAADIERELAAMARKDN